MTNPYEPSETSETTNILEQKTETLLSNIGDEKKPKLFLYSLLIPVIWFSVGLIVKDFLPEARLGAPGMFLIVYSAVWITSWHFSKTFKRQFFLFERIRLIVYTTIWTILVESLALFAYMNHELKPVSGAPLVGIFIFTFIFDAIFMWVGYTFLAKRFIEKNLNTLRKS